MITDYFGAIPAGRLRSAMFLGRCVVLIFVFFAGLLAIGVATGVGERLAGGDVTALEDTVARNFGFAAVAVLALIFLAGFALLNITAKRARDAGLPGWPTALVLGIAAGAAGEVAGRSVMASVIIVALIVLTVLPTRAPRGW